MISVVDQKKLDLLSKYLLPRYSPCRALCSDEGISRITVKFQDAPSTIVYSTRWSALSHVSLLYVNGLLYAAKHQRRAGSPPRSPNASKA